MQEWPVHQDQRLRGKRAHRAHRAGTDRVGLVESLQHRQADIALGEDTRGLSVWQAAEQAVEAVYRLSDDLEIPSLQALGFTEEEIPVLADMAFKDPQTIGNPRDLRRGSYVQIWQRAFDSGKK